AMEDVCAKFVSQKISKTRWRPLPAAALQPPDLFATGSWDNEDNRISIWFVGDLGNAGLNGEYQVEPQLLCDIKHNGDVMDMQFLDQERIVAASSTGTVTVFRHHQNNQVRSRCPQKKNLCFSLGNCSCLHTDLLMCRMQVVSFLSARLIVLCKNACFVLVALASVMLHGLFFSLLLCRASDRVPLHCVDRHPNQQHIVATGGQDGMLSIWDIRQGTMPVSLLNAHEAEMWEVHFHPSNPDHLFTCSEDGSLWHWDASTDVSEKPSFLHQGGRSTTYFSHNTINQSVVSAWLSNDPTKDRMEITNLIPNQTLSVNSLDILGPCLVYGTDAEAIYVNRQLFA
ncbi:NUP43 protein, partial [Corythaeola cristata]|nr:NUP43 protein [Corythaeola cristata]